jgi:ketosteroid isomerase-like protein
VSQENVEIVRRVLASFNDGDVESALAGFDSNGVWDNTRSEVPGLEQTYSGVAGLLELLGQINEAFPDYRLEAEEFVEAGDRVLVMAREIGRGGTSGITVDRAIAFVYTVVNGRISRFDTYTDRAQAMAEAAGEA